MINTEEYPKMYKKLSEFELEIHVAFLYKKIKETIQQYEHRNVLEIGVALDPFFSHFDDFQQWTVVDACHEFINHAEQLSVNDNRIQCIEGFFEERAELLKNNHYDFIIISSVLQDVKNAKEFLAKLKTICSPRTVVHFNVPNARSFHRMTGIEMGLLDDISKMTGNHIMSQHQHLFCMESFTELLIDAGFQIIESRTHFLKMFTTNQMNMMLRHGIIDEKILEGLDKMLKYMPDFGSTIFVNCRLES